MLIAHERAAGEIVRGNLEQLSLHCWGHVELGDEVPDGGFGDSPLHAGERFQGLVGLGIAFPPQHRLQRFRDYGPGVVQVLFAKKEKRDIV